MSHEALWPYALALYARPGVEAALLGLQDDHGQCVGLLIWALWAARQGRPADDDTLAAAAGMSQAWQAAAIEPLRQMRRNLKRLLAGAPPGRERLREGVKALELDAERMLLQQLESLSPPPVAAALDVVDALARAAAAWGATAPRSALEGLAALAG